MADDYLPFFSKPLPERSPLRAALDVAYYRDEAECVRDLLNVLAFTPELENKIHQRALQLVTAVRAEQKKLSGVEALMVYYDLSTEEGVLLMCLAEALLRVPDKQTEKLLIRDKLTSASWDMHIGASESSFVNRTTWGLALSGKILKKSEEGYFKSIWMGWLRRSSEPVIRKAVREAMKMLSENFILGRTIEEALQHSRAGQEQGYRYSYDMLGEVACTQEDADRYYQLYYSAISALSEDSASVSSDVIARPSISVKLTALHPRCEYTQQEWVAPFLIERMKTLVLHAKAHGVAVTIDAEEADRLDLLLDVFAALYADPDLQGWEGLGLAVQAYQKRAWPLIQWLITLARQTGRRIPVRLVKGAYWDTEIKIAQMGGLDGYPVFTRKINTDISYLACAKTLLAASDAIYLQLATHNAYTVAAILEMVDNSPAIQQFEFQCLQGMGKALHDYIVDKNKLHLPCRIYAPVGSYEDLLPYLVRRLLENGANSSFINQMADKKIPIEKLVSSPIAALRQMDTIANPHIPLPRDIFAGQRLNSRGLDFSNLSELKSLADTMQKTAKTVWQAAPFHREIHTGRPVLNPADHRDQVGIVEEATPADAETAINRAENAWVEWNERGMSARATLLKKVADLLEKRYVELLPIVVREAGKTLPNALSEVREAIDFCRYYADIAETQLIDQSLPGYTGETNVLRMSGRGIVLCVSPWNFPVAIFTGQVAAALVTGNVVIAKPARQTSLTAAWMVRLFYEAGISENVLQLLPGSSAVIADTLLQHPRLSGVLLTGSGTTAHAIQQALAKREGPLIPLVAETGGVNAMIADSTALPQQLVRDVIISAFDSSGQRCSALRVLFLQEDIAETVIRLLAGAMAQIRIGNPMQLSTDVGPVIDPEAHATLLAHQHRMQREAKLIYQVPLPSDTQFGTFIVPQAYELPDVRGLQQEVFGPILHVVRYQRETLDRVIDDINALGYGLTFGIQSRIDTTIDHIQRRIKAGNIYVNRNMIGAVVGVQPFGGSWLSGTGPKAGGPHYLLRWCTESTMTINTTAAGGNATLMVEAN